MRSIYRVLIALVIGVLSGTIAGAVILGAVGWFSDGSGDEPRWILVGTYLGAKLGLIFGGTVGLVIGLFIAVTRRHR